MEAEKKVIIVRFSGELSIKPDAEKYQAIERLCKQISLRLSCLLYTSDAADE